MSEDLDKKSYTMDIDNSLIVIPTNREEDSSDEKIIKDLSILIRDSDSKEPITLFSSQREITYDPSKYRLLPKMKVGDIMIDIPNVENT
jgi:hypothetical protein